MGDAGANSRIRLLFRCLEEIYLLGMNWIYLIALRAQWSAVWRVVMDDIFPWKVEYYLTVSKGSAFWKTLFYRFSSVGFRITPFEQYFTQHDIFKLHSTCTDFPCNLYLILLPESCPTLISAICFIINYLSPSPSCLSQRCLCRGLHYEGTNLGSQQGNCHIVIFLQSSR